MTLLADIKSAINAGTGVFMSSEIGGMPINTVARGNAVDLLRLLPAESINCVITSPPYW